VFGGLPSGANLEAPRHGLTSPADRSEFHPDRRFEACGWDALAGFLLLAQGTFFKSLLSFGIGSVVPRTRDQGGITQAVEKFIDGSQLADLPELLFENSLNVFATQSADAIFRTRSSVQPGSQAVRFVRGERGFGPAPFSILETGQSRSVITPNPVLYLSGRQIDLFTDGFGRLVLSGQNNNP
jgi:hypothetical protein